MELKSEPQKFDTINVTDIDVAFPGDLQTYTLREGVDAFLANGDSLTMTLGTPAVGTVTLYLQHAHWLAIRKRTIRVPKPEAPKAAE